MTFNVTAHKNSYTLNSSQVKILQHNRLDANSFVSVKLCQQTKNCTFFWGSIKNFRDGGFFGGLTAIGSTVIFFMLKPSSWRSRLCLCWYMRLRRKALRSTVHPVVGFGVCLAQAATKLRPLISLKQSVSCCGQLCVISNVIFFNCIATRSVVCCV